MIALTPDRKAVPLDQIAGDGVPTAILVGAEGDGLSPEARTAAGLQVRIPIVPEVDSLNLATAAAIALHRLARRAMTPDLPSRATPQGQEPSRTELLKDREVA